MYYLEPNKDHRTQSTREQTELSTIELHQGITYHYDDCYDIYSGWCNDNNLAYHYGYWDSPNVSFFVAESLNIVFLQRLNNFMQVNSINRYGLYN